jgi:hypothetical protein
MAWHALAHQLLGRFLGFGFDLAEEAQLGAVLARRRR